MRAGRALLAGVVAAAAVVVACVAIDSGTSRPPTLTACPADDRIQVLLGPRFGAPLVGADGPFSVHDESGREVYRGPSLPADTRVAATSREVRLGDRVLGKGPFAARPLARTVLSVQGRPYRGALLLRSRGGTEVLNLVDVEDYLLGVVPSEMPDRFGLEALKAQAVAARSYALHARDQGQRLYADQRSQVYGGIKAESLISTRAVKQTAGEVLKLGDATLSAWYHSTCGGRTRPARDIFPNAPSGAIDRSVLCEDCRDSPHFAWTRALPAAAVCDALGLSPGRLDAVTFKPAAFPARDESVTVRVGGRQATASGDDFRARLSSGKPYAEQLLSTLWAAPPRVEGETLVIEGRGWGHGVGLCQYGARGRAGRGLDYRDILSWYYPGAELARLP